MAYNYAKEKLYDAVRTLALGHEDVRFRLVDAYKSFHTLTTLDLPEEMRADYEWVVDQIRKLVSYKKRFGNYTLPKKSFIEVARKIWEMYEKL